MPAKQHPLDVQSVGEDTYIVMSKGLAQAPSALRAISIMGWRMAKLPLAIGTLTA